MAAKNKKATGILVTEVFIDEAHVEIPVQEGSLNVWYRPSAYSGKMSNETDRYLEKVIEEASGRLSEFDQMRHVFAHGLSQIVTTWDLLDEDGPIGTDLESILNRVPLPVMKLVRQSVNLHFFQTMLGERPTSNGSSQTGAPE